MDNPPPPPRGHRGVQSLPGGSLAFKSTLLFPWTDGCSSGSWEQSRRQGRCSRVTTDPSLFDFQVEAAVGAGIIAGAKAAAAKQQAKGQTLKERLTACRASERDRLTFGKVRPDILSESTSSSGKLEQIESKFTSLTFFCAFDKSHQVSSVLLPIMPVRHKCL